MKALSKFKYTLAAGLAALSLGGCAAMEMTSNTQITNLDQNQVAGSTMIVRDTAGAFRLDLNPDGTATATNLYGTRSRSSGGGSWMLNPEKSAVCLHGAVWWQSYPCWRFYGTDWAHATDAITTYHNAHLAIEMRKVGTGN